MKKPLLLFFIPMAIVMGIYSSLVFLKPAPIQLQAATWLGESSRPLPEFELTDHNNKAVNNDSLKGKWHLLFFGYTNCPDICPDTLQVLANMMPLIKDKQVLDRLQITFISVDPERDDLEKMKAYVTYFHESFLSARTELEKLRPLTKTLGIYHSIDKTDKGEYQVAHSGVLTLIDPQGQFSGLFSSPHDSNKIAHDLTALING